MRIRRPVVASFDELMATRYGHPDSRLLRGPENAEYLLDGYYGKLPTRVNGRAKAKAPAAALSIQMDDGGQIVQCRCPPPAPPSARPAPPPEQKTPVAPERKAPAAPEAKPEPEVLEPEPVTALSHGIERSAGSEVSESDLAADVASILSGESLYDPTLRKTVRRGEKKPPIDLKEYPRAPSTSDEVAERERGEPAANNARTIFDRIAKSMQYAGAYDLGEVELENRFTDFDRMEELKEKARESLPEKPTIEKPAIEMPDTTDFMEDLDAIRNEKREALSAPLYDTGEHVLAGIDLYRDQLMVGKAPGVLFSYGELIAMGDFFNSVEDMMGEDATRLAELKRLIQSSTAFYKGRKADRSLSVSDEKWQAATQERYLDLAEKNYEHFSPSFLFADPHFEKVAAGYGNHRHAWEEHHAKAIAAAQQMAIDPAYAGHSYLPMWPLIVNAFGDHFLTDAFAAGHIVNKAEIVEYFKSKFYQGGSLTAEANRFFEKVAELAWKNPKVEAAFSKLETFEPYKSRWNIVGWNPDIDDAGRLGKVLKGAAEKEPDRMANMAVKAVHDVLNKDGIDVENAARAKPWRLKGDGYLMDSETLAAMKRAVEQSVANIVDPSILASNLDLGPHYAKVWAHVPRLPAASQAKVKAMVVDYVSPGSAALAQKAADIVIEQLNTLVKLLKDKKELKDA